MRNLCEQDGIFITDELISLLKRSVQLEGRQSKLARAMGVPENNLSNWLGNTQNTISMISWDQWKKVRSYLIKVELIDGDDARWMLPSQMRERLLGADGIATGEEERRLLYLFGQLNAAGRAALLKTAESLAATPGLTNSGSAAAENKAE